MKELKKWFVLIMTFMFVLILFTVADIIFAGLIMFVVSSITQVWVLSAFKWSFIILLIIELAFTIPAVIKSVKGEE